MAAAESQALPCAAIPKVASAADLLGVLYVREGATLGGRLLARKLEPLCGPDGAGRSFFIGTPHDGALWAELCTTLDRFGNKQHIATMTQAACATFAALEAWLDGNQLIESGKPP